MQLKKIIKWLADLFYTEDPVKFTRVIRRIESVEYYQIRDGF
jgi:hypothetical protein